MKLKDLSIDGYNRSTRLGQFADGLTMVYGESGAGKSTVRQFIADSILGVGEPNRSTRFGDSRKNALRGSLSVYSGAEELHLSRTDDTSPTVVGPISNSHITPVNASSAERMLRDLSGNHGADLYETVFNVSFLETASNFARLGSVLQNRFGVPVGPGAAGDNSEFLKWKRESKDQTERIESLRTRIDSLSHERSDYIREIESNRQVRQTQISDIESQINQIISRIHAIEASSIHDQISQIDHEITQLRILIDNAKPRVEYVAPEPANFGYESTIYQRLDEIDNQIRRWRHVQSDIQNQRVRLRDEMLVWNELTLDSDQHPYHNARSILVALESKVDEAERNANQWSEADVTRVDTTQLSLALNQICKRMRDDLYGLCNELGQQYKHIRHKSAAAELKQLRRCYKEMGENIDRLLERRQVVIREIRELDPAGAEAIVRGDSSFCQCAQHKGHLEARRRFVGELARPVPQTTYHAPDLTHQRAQLAQLERQRMEITNSYSTQESELNSLNNRHADLTRQRDRLMSEINVTDLERKIQSIDSELLNLNNELNGLLRQVDEIRNYVPPQPNPLIEQACRYLTQLTEGELTQVFLSDPIGHSRGLSNLNFQIRDRHGKVLNVSGIDPGLQDQVYLSLMLATVDQVRLQGQQLPIVIDDAFNRIDPSRVSVTLQLLNDFAKRGNQIIALTQHRYLADRLPGVPLLELAPTIPDRPSYKPDRRSTTAPAPYVAPSVAPRRDTDWQTENLKHQEYGIPYPRPRQSSQPRPYPLSKYPRTRPTRVDEQKGYTVAYPSLQKPVMGSQKPPAATVPVEDFGDPIGFLPAIDESTMLRRIDLFDATQLRNFENQNIQTVGELLTLHPNQADSFGVHADLFERWQGQLVLLVTVPGIRINDTRILVACGVTDPEQLETSHPQQLFERISRFLATSEGRRFAANSEPISIERIGGWYRGLDATRSKRQQRPGRYADRSARSSSRTQIKTHSTSGNVGLSASLTQPAVGSSSKTRSTSPRRSSERTYESQNTARPVRVYPSEDRTREPREPRMGAPRIREPRQPRQRRQPRESVKYREPRESREPSTQHREPRETRQPRQHRERQDREPLARRESRDIRPSRNVVPALAPATLASTTSKRSERSTGKKRSKKSESGQKKLKFYLDLNDHIEAAPSIGPKTAERFEKVGIHTVSDFLKQTSESIATKINYKRMTAKVIRDWQHQARLICRIPNLRGHDAQLLVACNLTEPEQISTMQPQSLFEIIGPFSETKEGLKIIRNGKKPDLAEITDWISWAGHTRSLQAA